MVLNIEWDCTNNVAFVGYVEHGGLQPHVVHVYSMLTHIILAWNYIILGKGQTSLTDEEI